MRLAWACAAALVLAACSSALPPQPAPASPGPSAEPGALAPMSHPGASADLCGAAALQSLIGRSRAEAPVPVAPDRQRVACTTCPAAEDQRPERLNILFDAETGLIREIRCG